MTGRDIAIRLALFLAVLMLMWAVAHANPPWPDPDWDPADVPCYQYQQYVKDCDTYGKLTDKYKGNLSFEDQERYFCFMAEYLKGHCYAYALKPTPVPKPRRRRKGDPRQ